MPNVIEIKVPDIGDYKDVPVIEVLIKEGDSVVKDQALVVLESDKSTMEVPSPGAGVVRGLKVRVGDKLSQGDTICGLEAEGATASEPAAVAAAPAVSASHPGKSTQADLITVTGSAAPTVAPGAATGPISVTVPDIGDYSDVPIIEVLVRLGDSVVKDQALVVLESEKSTMEVPSPAAGTITRLMANVGDKVSKGVVLLELSGAGTAQAHSAVVPVAPALIPPQPVPARSAQPSAESRHKTALFVEAASSAAGVNAHAGPATRKFARELGVELSRVYGTGPKGRVVIEDVQKYVKQRMSTPPVAAATAPVPGSGISPIPAQDFSLYGEIENKPLARIRKLSAAHLHRAWVNIPHVTQTDEADITELEAFRKSASEDGGVKLTLLPFIMKAVSVAIRQQPEFGSSLSPDGTSLILKKYCHIGFAADTPNGLVVPVVRDVWGKTLTNLAVETGELAKKARDGKLKPDEMKGGCFSISSLGGIGGSHFTPIVNAPEVGILGVSRGAIKPVWDGKSFQPRLMVPLSLSYDHRVIDGAYAARFIVALVKLLGDTRRLSL